MSFDPEKVERYDCETNPEIAGMAGDPDGDYVQISDYNQLLALYAAAREALRKLDPDLTIEVVELR